MDWQLTPYTPFLVITGVATLALTVFVYRRRRATGTFAATGLFAIVSAWNFTYALELSSSNLAAQTFWANVQYLFIPCIPVLWLLFTVQYTGRTRWLPRWLTALLFLEPAVVLFLAWGSETYPWLRSGAVPVDVGGAVLVEWHYGAFFWFHTAYAYALTMIGTALLIPVILRSPFLYRAQVVFVLAGTLAPWIANAVYIAGLSPFPYLDLTPFAFSIVSATVTFGLLRLHFLDVVPVARDMVVEGLWEGVVVIGINGRIADVNRTGAEAIGRPVVDLVGREASEVIPDLMAVGAEASSELMLERDGETYTYDVIRSSVLDHRGERRGELIVLHDVTTRKQAEEERVRAQRLVAAHELAAGISHNLNNILIGILAPAQRLRDGNSDQPRRDADTIVAAAQRAQDLVRRLHRSGGGAEPERTEAVDVSAVITEAVEASRPRWQDETLRRGQRIELQTDLANLPLVEADPTGLHDLIVNLIFNSVDAMPEGGHLIISSRAVQDNSVLVTVSDDGTGMDEDVQRRIFEPFFTTKHDVGSGLGLATAYRAVRSWGGDIAVESRPGAGTTFRVRMNVWDGPLPVTSAQAVVQDDGTPRILIAEDEGIVAMVLEDCVRRLGFQPDVVDRGDIALERLRTGRYGVALLDLGIPGMEGHLVAREARGLFEMTLVLMTGWSLTPEDPRLAAFDLALQKPFDAREAEATIQRAIELQGARKQGESRDG